MTRKPMSWLQNPHPLMAVAMLVGAAALLTAWLFYFDCDNLWGRPLTDDAVMALYFSVMGVPALASTLAIWTFGKPSEATAGLPRAALLVGRAPLVAFLLAPLLWSLAALIAWHGGQPALPVNALYLCGGVQVLACTLFLATGIVYSRHRPDALIGIMG